MLETLMALIDVTAERIGSDGTAWATLPAKEVARRVIELYWPQTVPCGAATCRPARVSRTHAPRTRAAGWTWRQGYSPW